ncbi:MAG TPA: PKD domain-containing protein [Solirubrobacteraceae bacterium]|nr:PKD domain-containing protein [Solirubrobacteraceae bacterium]
MNGRPCGAGLVGVFAVCALSAAADPADAALYNLRAAPQAAFVWTPQLPRIGEPISLKSTSSEPGGQITSYAWDFHDNGPFGAFEEGGPVAGASFATPAPHVVRLRVTDRDGLSNIAAETIQMTPPPPSVHIMNPFPIIRITGRTYARRVRIRQLAVRAPAGVRIKVRCRGRCPVKLASLASPSRTGRLEWVRVRRFERSFPAGAVLEVRVSGKGEIGAFTRFAVRRHKLPTRSDSCLDTPGIRAIACPAG